MLPGALCAHPGDSRLPGPHWGRQGHPSLWLHGAQRFVFREHESEVGWVGAPGMKAVPRAG